MHTRNPSIVAAVVVLLLAGCGSTGGTGTGGGEGGGSGGGTAGGSGGGGSGGGTAGGAGGGTAGGAGGGAAGGAGGGTAGGAGGGTAGGAGGGTAGGAGGGSVDAGPTSQILYTSDGGYPFDLDQDSSSLYWVESVDINGAGPHRLLKQAKTGGAVANLGAMPGGRVRGFRYEQGHAYWSDGFRFRRLPVDGGAAQILFQIDGGLSSTAVTSSAIYWAPSGVTAQVHATNLDGTNDRTLYNVGVFAARAIAPSDAGLFFASSADVLRLLEDGGTATVRTVSFVEDLQVEPGRMFYSQSIGARRLLVAPLDGGTSIALAGSSSLKFAIGQANVFVGTTTDAGGLAQISKDGGNPVPLYGSAIVEGVVLDGTTLYFTDRVTGANGGAVVKLGPVQP
jgi:hypothetical protein